MAPVICLECNVLPTHYKCVVCKINYVCPECSFKRGHDDLNEITCQICSTSVESNATLSLSNSCNDQTKDAKLLRDKELRIQKKRANEKVKDIKLKASMQS